MLTGALISSNPRVERNFQNSIAMVSAVCTGIL